MNRSSLVILFLILGLLLILSVINVIAYRELLNTNGGVTYWLNVLAVLIILVVLIWIGYEVIKLSKSEKQS
jgi:putative effector of murein hydrolase LrgA (UPF0299 family)